MGGCASLRLLQRQGLWPADAELCAALLRGLDHADGQERRARRWAGSSTPSDSAELQHLAEELNAKPGPVLLLKGRRAQPVAWLARQGRWPMERPVQPVASRDPWRVRECLEAEGVEVPEEQPLVKACLGPKPALVVLERPVLGSLPLELGPWMHDPEVAWLAPAPLVRPSAHRLRWHEAGWRLWTAQASLP
jgi:hypothetical protein